MAHVRSRRFTYRRPSIIYAPLFRARPVPEILSIIVERRSPPTVRTVPGVLLDPLTTRVFTARKRYHGSYEY